jgi:hypothetical protein
LDVEVSSFQVKAQKKKKEGEGNGNLPPTVSRATGDRIVFFYLNRGMIPLLRNQWKEKMPQVYIKWRILRG